MVVKNKRVSKKARPRYKMRAIRYHIAGPDGFFILPEEGDMFRKGSIVKLSNFKTAKGEGDSAQNELQPVVTVKDVLSDVADWFLYVLFSENRQLPEHCSVYTTVLYCPYT